MRIPGFLAWKVGWIVEERELIVEGIEEHTDSRRGDRADLEKPETTFTSSNSGLVQ